MATTTSMLAGNVYPIVGAIVPWRAAIEVPGDEGFGEFKTPNVTGLARVVGDQIDVLAIDAQPQRQGHGRMFIIGLMREYRCVRFLEVHNLDLADALRRRGFVDFMAYERGEIYDGLTWTR